MAQPICPMQACAVIMIPHWAWTREEPLNRFLSKVPKGRFEAANGPATVCGVGIEISDRTGLAEKAAPLRIGAHLEETIPAFWR